MAYHTRVDKRGLPYPVLFIYDGLQEKVLQLMASVGEPKNAVIDIAAMRNLTNENLIPDNQLAMMKLIWRSMNNFIFNPNFCFFFIIIFYLTPEKVEGGGNSLIIQFIICKFLKINCYEKKWG